MLTDEQKEQLKACPLDPIADSVICIKPEAKQRRTAGGLVLPEKTDDRQIKCLVVAVGPGRVDGDKRWPCQVQVGDWVWFDRSVATSIREGGQEYLLIVEHNITCVTTVPDDQQEVTNDGGQG